MPWLINAAQVDKFRKNPKNVIVLDASWYLPSEGRDAHQEFLQNHIVSAQFLDLNQFNDPTTSLPNMLIRDEQRIKKLVGDLGITSDHKIILYDNSPLHTSCRAYWMFKIFGHNPNQLYILDGGFEAWRRYGGKLEQGASKNIIPRTYDVNFQAHFLRSLMQMKSNLHHPQEQVVDARHAVRFAGGAEHRSNLRRGHIPGSYCFPYTTVFEGDGRFKSPDKIRKQITGIGVDLDVPIITTCGSGITSAILNFVLDLLNCTNHSLYDGSWSEWGANELYPGEESLAERPVATSLDD